METELDKPGFDSWFQELIPLAASADPVVSTAYKGNWVDFYAQGFTPAEAIQASKD